MKAALLRKTMPYAALSVATVGLTLLAVRAHAAGVPDVDGMTYTGYLENADGTPLTGDHSVTVGFWQSEKATKVLCQANNSGDTTLVSGRFQIKLPAECTDAVKASPDVWVEVEVDGGPLGRTKLGVVPYALEASHATSSDDATHAQSAETAANAPLVTEWAAYTPALSIMFGAAVPANVHDTKGSWRREGDSMHVRIYTVFSAAAPNPGPLVWSLPNAKSVNQANLLGYVGTGIEGKSGLSVINLHVAVRPEGYVFSRHSTGDVTDQAPFASGNGLYISLDFLVPITGWTTTTGK